MQANNWLIKNVLDMEWELGNVTLSILVELWKLRGFVRQFLELLMVINRFQQTSQSLLLLLGYVRDQLGMLLWHLLPSIMASAYLQDILLKIQTELSYSLQLPFVPTKKLWHYYISLCCLILVEEDKILALEYAAFKVFITLLCGRGEILN